MNAINHVPCYVHKVYPKIVINYAAFIIIIIKCFLSMNGKCKVLLNVSDSLTFLTFLQNKYLGKRN